MELIIPSLGRSVSLGMLYNSQRNEFIEGGTLWTDSVIKQNTKEQALLQSSFDFAMEDTISKKSEFLDVSGNAQMSVLCGSVVATGSASYLHDHREYSRQARVTCKYSSRTIFAELQFSDIISEMLNDQVNDSVTHFVSAIHYGADAIFVFDMNVSEMDDYQLTKSDLKAKVMFFEVYSKSTHEPSRDSKRTKDIKCKFHGDIKLDAEPETYEEAIKICKSLPALIASQGVIKEMTVWVTPINKVTDVLQKECPPPINESVLKDIENELESILNMKIKCNDLLKKPACSMNNNLQKNIIEARTKIEKSEQELKSSLRATVSDATSTQPIERAISTELHLYTNNVGSPRVMDQTIENLTIETTVLDSFVKLIKSNTRENNDTKQSQKNELNVILPPMNTECSERRQYYNTLRRLAETADFSQISSDSVIRFTEDDRITKPTISVGNTSQEDNFIMCPICQQRQCKYQRKGGVDN